MTNTGHEPGLDLILHQNPVKHAHLWMHLGANFAAKLHCEVRLQSSDDEAVSSLAPLLTEITPAVVTYMGERISVTIS